MERQQELSINYVKLRNNTLINRDDIRNFALNEFSFLTKGYSFSQPRIIESVWLTDLYYLNDFLVIDICLEFRDFYFSILLLKLQQGVLSTNSIIEEREGRCKDLITLISEKAWPIDEKLLIFPKRKWNNIDMQFLYNKLHQDKLILESVIDIILEQQSTIFSK